MSLSLYLFTSFNKSPIHNLPRKIFILLRNLRLTLFVKGHEKSFESATELIESQSVFNYFVSIRHQSRKRAARFFFHQNYSEFSYKRPILCNILIFLFAVVCTSIQLEIVGSTSYHGYDDLNTHKLLPTH